MGRPKNVIYLTLLHKASFPDHIQENCSLGMRLRFAFLETRIGYEIEQGANLEPCWRRQVLYYFSHGVGLQLPCVILTGSPGSKYLLLPCGVDDCVTASLAEVVPTGQFPSTPSTTGVLPHLTTWKLRHLWRDVWLSGAEHSSLISQPSWLSVFDH